MSAASNEAIWHLRALAEKVTGVENLRVDRLFEDIPPRLSLRNTSMRDGRGWELLSGSILVVTDRDRDWFIWDHGDRLALADAVDDAAKRVLQVLTFEEPLTREAGRVRGRLGALS